MEHFGDRLRRLRGERAQKTVAEALGMPQTTLSSLEKQPNIPRGDVLKKLADYYGVPITYFYTAPTLKSSEAGKAWLDQLKSNSNVKGRETIAAHSSVQLDSKLKERIAERLKQKWESDNE